MILIYVSLSSGVRTNIAVDMVHINTASKSDDNFLYVFHQSFYLLFHIISNNNTDIQLL